MEMKQARNITELRDRFKSIGVPMGSDTAFLTVAMLYQTEMIDALAAVPTKDIERRLDLIMRLVEQIAKAPSPEPQGDLGKEIRAMRLDIRALTEALSSLSRTKGRLRAARRSVKV